MTLLQDPTTEVRVPFARTHISGEALDAALRVLSSGWVTTGPETAEFEREFADWVGAEHAVAVSSCTSAIELSLRAMRLPRGSRVLTSTYTFCGAVHAIVHAGLQPVLADVDPVTLMPDAETLTRAAHQAGGVQAMVLVHFAGHPTPVRRLADAVGLPLERVVEDAAHAVGTWVDAEQVGTISGSTCFSFYATKNLPIGEGGMVTTADGELAERLRSLRLHGMSHDAWRRYLPGGSWRYSVDTAGTKANMTDLQSAIGRAQLRHLARWQDRRRSLVALYDEMLSGVAGISLPPRPESGAHAWHLYVVRVEPDYPLRRDELVGALDVAGIGTSVHFIPLHQMPYFREVTGCVPGQFPAADAAFDTVLSLPLHPSLTRMDVQRVCHALIDVRRRHAAQATARLGGSHAPAQRR